MEVHIFLIPNYLRDSYLDIRIFGDYVYQQSA